MSRLVVVEGPGRGNFFEVEGGATIGRSRSCTVRLDGRHLSRVHARVERRPDGLYVVDAGSRNGIYVNGKRAQEHLLRTADELEIGEFVLLFDPPGEVPEAKSRAGASVHEMLADPLTEEVSDRDLRLAHERLRLVIETAHLLHSVEDDRAAMKVLLERVLGEVVAPRGFVMIVDGTGKPVPAAKSAPEGQDEFSVSSVIYHQVSREKRAVIGKDIVRNGPLAGRTVALLCAPLVAGNRFLGFLYLDGPSESTQFSRADLRFVAILARTCALLLSGRRREGKLFEPIWKGEAALPDLLGKWECEALHEALRRAGGDHAQAASLVGMPPADFEARLQKYGLPPADPAEWKSVET